MPLKEADYSMILAPQKTSPNSKAYIRIDRQRPGISSEVLYVACSKNARSETVTWPLVQDDTVYAPDFALWRGINDRFALLRPAAAAVWKRRVFFSLHACRFRPIHAEIFASDFAAATGLSYLPIKRFGFVRMRSTGVVAALDETYPDLCAGGASSRHA